MRENQIVSVVVAPDAWGADVTFCRADKTVRTLPDTGNATRRALEVLSEGAYTSTIQQAINPKTGYSYIVSITYKPMQFSENKYREALRAVYFWIHRNIDGVLEDNDQAEYFWHLLGAMVADTFLPVWSRKSHLEAFYEQLEGNHIKQAWEYFFTRAREKR